MFRRGCLVPADVAGGFTIAEVIGQRGPSACDSRPNGSGRNIEDRRDLRVVETDEIPKGDRGAVLRREPRERGVDVELIGHRFVEPPRADARLGNDVDRSGPTSPPPGLVERGIRGDAVAPGCEPGAAVERLDAARDREERFLGGIERVFGVHEHAAADRVHQPRVSLQQRVERAAIPVRGGGGELLVVAIVGVHRGER